MHKGGIADKVGNRFEARWLTHQLLGLLDGTVQAITIEGLGDNAQGFEFSITRACGTEWHQCKRQTASGTWSIAALDAAGVLAAFRTKTGSDRERCLFVSSDPSPQIKLLQDKLPATHNLDAFEASLSKTETVHWSVLKERLAGEATTAYRFLRQSEFRTLSEHDLADNLRARLAYWFRGNPDTIAAQFRVWLEEERNFNRPLDYDDVLAFVRSAAIETKQYELDRALPGRIRDATTSYVGSYPPLGSGLFQIERAAVQKVLDGLQAGTDTVLVTGTAGAGKSAVIADVINRLRSDGTLHLAFRIDQVGALATLDELGAQTIGIADNPVVILEQLATNRRAVLIIDQADAVSEISGRIAELRRVVLELVRKAALYPRVQIIFVCRSFDLENDHAYRDIAEAKNVVRVDVGQFERSEIDQVLNRLGILHDAENTRLMALLALPIGLTLAAALAQSRINDLRRVENLSELYNRLLRTRDQEVQRDFRPGWSIYAPLTALAEAMSERQEFVAPVATLDLYPCALDILQRVGLIVVRGQRVGFIHETLFDYLHARAFVQGRKPLIDFLLVNEQTLFRRTQTRQILAFERELERTRYLTDLGAVLSDTRVRAHIRETIVRWLATIPDPTAAEWELVACYAQQGKLPLKAGNIIFGRKPWFDLLHGQGVLNSWLACGGNDLNWVLDFLRSVAPLVPEEVSKLIDSFMERRPDRVRDVLGTLRYIDPKTNSRLLADSMIAALNCTNPEDWARNGNEWDDYYAPWIKAAPQEAARIFGAQLKRWFQLKAEGHPFEYYYQRNGSSLYWLNELAKAAPLAFLEQILPSMRLAMKRSINNNEFPAEDSIWYWRHWDHTDVRSLDLLTVIRTALAKVAHDAPEEAIQLLRAMKPEAYITSLHLSLETIPENPERLRDLLVEQLNNSGLFNAGWHMAPGHSAARAIAATMPWLKETERERAESAILALRPEIDNAKRVIARHEVKVGGSKATPKTGDYPTYCLNNSGKRQWSILRQIEIKQLSLRAAKRLAELNRKFRGQKPEEPDGIRGGWVRSPIASENTKFMNDDAWLSAIVKFSRPSKQRQYGSDILLGGAEELSRELKERTKEDPQRFLELLKRFPENVSQAFAQGISAGIAETAPHANRIECFLATAEANPPARPDDRSLIWMIRACEEPLGPRAEALLFTVAIGHDDSTGIGDIQHGDRTKEPDWKRALTLGEDLNLKAINSARGSALELIGGMCWHSKKAFEKYRSTIDAIIGTPVAAHIHSALGSLLMSALKHEGKQGVDWVLRTARACPEALYTHNGQQIVPWVADLDAVAFMQLIDLYLTKEAPLARGFGAMAVFQQCLKDSKWLPLAENLISINADCRSAAAAVAATNFGSVRSSTTCTDWLIRLFNDEDENVRHEASECFRRMRASDIRTHIALFEAYVASRYFAIRRTYFLHQLEHAPPGHDEFVIKQLEDMLKANTEDGHDPQAHELYEVGKLVLKLYAVDFH